MRNLLKHPAIVLLVTILAVLYYLSLDSSARKADVSSETVGILEQEVDKMASDVSVLEKRLETADTPLAKEKVVRNEMLMKKEGEYVLQLPEIESSEPAPEVQQDKTPWQEWQEILF